MNGNDDGGYDGRFAPPRVEYGFDEATEPQLDLETLRGANLINQRYELKQELGAGGFATVYKAWDQNLQRDVAIKIMRPELLQAEHKASFMQRFEREALLVARLDHTHLAPVYETGLIRQNGQDTAFIVMKYLEGQDLDEILKGENDISLERKLKILSQTLEALAYIHTQGVVHKDLKPSNIFVCQDHLGRDHTYLMDFGIAHDTQDEKGRLTNTGVLTGTFQYMPPEYVLQHQATSSVDVFQMGLIITELLTGTPLIHHSTTVPALVARYLRQDPLELPPELASSRAGAVILKALEHDTSRRYANAGELFKAFSTLNVDDFPVLTKTMRASAIQHSEQLFKKPLSAMSTAPATPSSLGPPSTDVGATAPPMLADASSSYLPPHGPNASASGSAIMAAPTPRTNRAGVAAVALVALVLVAVVAGTVVTLQRATSPKAGDDASATAAATTATTATPTKATDEAPPAEVEPAAETTPDEVAKPSGAEAVAPPEPKETAGADATPPPVEPPPAEVEKKVTPRKKKRAKKKTKKPSEPAKVEKKAPEKKKPSISLPPPM